MPPPPPPPPEVLFFGLEVLVLSCKLAKIFSKFMKHAAHSGRSQFKTTSQIVAKMVQTPLVRLCAKAVDASANLDPSLEF